LLGVVYLGCHPMAWFGAQQQDGPHLQAVSVSRAAIGFAECDGVVYFTLRNGTESTIVYHRVSATTGNVALAVRDDDRWTFVPPEYLGIRDFEVPVRPGETVELWVRVPAKFFGRTCRVQVAVISPTQQLIYSEPFVIDWP